MKQKISLVELLVVIAGIAIFTGTLLPALNSARASGIGTSCKNKLKQIELRIYSDYHTFKHSPLLIQNQKFEVWDEALIEYEGMPKNIAFYPQKQNCRISGYGIYAMVHYQRCNGSFIGGHVESKNPAGFSDIAKHRSYT